MQIGIVGKPSSGKSTFFNAMTMSDVPMASYPFTTIDANKGMAFVRVDCVDKEFDVQCNPRTGYCENGIRFVPVEVIDVAGLVPGAHQGKGRGNQFLSDLAHADVLIHVVDASGSTDAEGQPVGLGQHNPCEDIRFLEDEISQWFYGVLEKNWKTFYRKKVISKTELLDTISQSLSGIGATPQAIEQIMKQTGLIDKKLEEWTEEDKKNFAVALRTASKPIVIAANKCDLEGAQENVEKMQKEFPELTIVPCSAISELTLKKAAKDHKVKYLAGEKNFESTGDLDDKQKQGLDYIQKKVLDVFGSTGVQDTLDKTVFEVLKYIAIYPGGSKKLCDQHGNYLPDCFLMPPHSTALDFAFKLHTDFGENFIRAIDVKTKKMVGKEHQLKHRDVIEIIHSAK